VNIVCLIAASAGPDPAGTDLAAFPIICTISSDGALPLRQQPCNAVSHKENAKWANRCSQVLLYRIAAIWNAKRYPLI